METLEINDEGLMPANIEVLNNISDVVAITSDFNIVRLTEITYDRLLSNSNISDDALYIITDQQLNAHNKTVISVADPLSDTHGVNKRYVDSSISTIINTNISTELTKPDGLSTNEYANGIYISDNQGKRAAFLQLAAYNISNDYRPGDTLYKMSVNRGLGNNNIKTKEAVLGIGLHALKKENGEISNYQGFAVCPSPLSNSNTNEIATTDWITDRIANLINVLSTNI